MRTLYADAEIHEIKHKTKRNMPNEISESRDFDIRKKCRVQRSVQRYGSANNFTNSTHEIPADR